MPGGGGAATEGVGDGSAMAPRLRARPIKANPRKALAYSALGALACGLLDFASGPTVQFPITYVVPVLIVAWYGFPRTGLVLAAGLAITRAVFELSIWGSARSGLSVLENALIRVTLLATVAGLAYLAGRSVRRVAMLEGILPICSHCKRIRDQDEQWYPVESYVTDHSNAVFSHGICPECMNRHYGELER